MDTFISIPRYVIHHIQHSLGESYVDKFLDPLKFCVPFNISEVIECSLKVRIPNEILNIS